jgi:hypothetical protein
VLLAHFVLLWVGGVLVVGFFGLLVLVLSAVARMVRALWRAVVGPWSGSDEREREGSSADQRPCSYPRCGHLNRGEARYCARCGRPLESVQDVDRYG